MVAAALLLGLASVYAIFKMTDGSQENINGTSVAEFTPSPAAGPTQPSVGAGTEAIPKEPVTISKIESYEVVKGDGYTFRVRMVVDNAPGKMQVELGERPATIIGNKELPGGRNRREVLAAVNFTREVEVMKRRPDAPLPLLVKVSDGDDPENYEVQEFEVEPPKLGLEDAAGLVPDRAVTVREAPNIRRATPAPTPKAQATSKSFTTPDAETGESNSDA